MKFSRKEFEEIVAEALDELPAETTQDALVEHIGKLNDSPDCTGIILQMPLPKEINGRAVQAQIAQAKDVEGMSPANMGTVIAGDPYLGPCTAIGAVELILSLGLECEVDVPDWVEEDIRRRGLVRGLYGKEVVVVGHSEIVGKPSALLLLDKFCTVTVCHIGTKDLKAHTTAADVLVVAVGKAGLIKGEHIKPGGIVIDVGINRVKTDEGKSKIVGDVVFDEAVEIAGQITPVPGGVGTVTTAMLLKNIVDAARLQM